MNAIDLAPNIEALVRVIFNHDTWEEAFAFEMNGGKYPKGMKKAKIKRLKSQGWMQADIARLLEVDESYVSAVLRKK